MWCLCALCVLLSLVQGHNPNISDQKDSEQNLNISDQRDSGQNPNISDQRDSRQNPNISDQRDSRQNSNISDQKNSGQNPNISDRRDSGQNLNISDRRGSGQDLRSSDLGVRSARPGSDVLLSPGYNLTIDPDNKQKCDGFIWTYKGSSQGVRIIRSRRCELREGDGISKDPKDPNSFLPQSSNEPRSGGNPLPPITFTRFSNYNISLGGDLTLINVSKDRSGKYSVTVLNPDGEEIYRGYYTLHVQDPVSEPLLKVSCLPDGGADILCGSDIGDDPRFSIVVNEAPLLDNVPPSRTVGGVRVTAASPGPWSITCSVGNRVSTKETRRTQDPCPVAPSDPILDVSCLHNGSLQISCSVDNGTDLIFSLSVNGTSVVNNVTTEQKRVNVISSSPGPWEAQCYVRNSHWEKRSENKTYEACPVAPSDPILDFSCLHNGSLQISCSVDNGTYLIFSLSVNGTSVVNNVTTEEKGVNIILSPGAGEAQCSVRNSHWEKNKTRTFEACEDPVSVPFINSSCQHDGSARVVCQIERGSNVTYTWTVNGKEIEGRTTPNLSIRASEFTSGAINITCSANNSLSKEQSNYTDLFCEAPLPAPIIHSSCQPDGSASVTCAVKEGNIARYHWSINGNLSHRHKGPSVTINASMFTSGAINISCSAENSIGQVYSNDTNINCGDLCSDCLQRSIIGGAVALVVTTSPFLFAAFYIGRNTRQ